MRIINDVRYEPYDPEHPTYMELKGSPHLYMRNHVEFVNVSRDNDGIDDYLNHSIVLIRAIQNIPE